MKPKTIRKENVKAYLARVGVTFSRVDVPKEWQAMQGAVVYKATTSKKKRKLERFGLSLPHVMAAYIGIEPSGDFSII